MKRKEPHEREDSPDFLQRHMQQLEEKIETEVMSFEKEKKLMEQIKTLRKKYLALKEGSTVFKQLHETSKEIKKLKRDADTSHQDLQTKAKISQEIQ